MRGETIQVSGDTRVLVAAPCDFRDFPVGGYTTFARNVLPSLGPVVCALGVDADREGAGRRTVSSGGRTVEYLSAGRLSVSSTVPQRVQIAFMVGRLGRAVREWRPSVVYSNSPEMTVALAWCLRGSGVPIVHHVHGAGTDTSRSPHVFLRNRAGTASLTWLLNEAVRRSSLVLGVSGESLEPAARLGRPHRLVPTCVDTTVFRPVERSADGDSVRIGSVGRVDGVKNLPVLLRAVRVLVDDGVDVTAVIAGDGPALEDVRELARALDLDREVSFLGAVDAAGAARVFQGADVAVMTSHFEGLPTSMLEAMATGLPVVAPRLPGIAEVLVDSDNGVLFDGYEPRDVACAIMRAKAEGPRLGRAALETVHAAYSADVVGAAVNDILRGVAEGVSQGRGT